MAALLLVLYTFMATPVHCWHHHPSNDEAMMAQVTASQDNPDLSVYKGGSWSNHCDICAHHYSVYEPAADWPHTFSARLLRAVYAEFRAATLTATAQHFSNKGPPAGHTA